MMSSGSRCEVTLFLIVAGLMYLVEAADGAIKYQRCYNTSVEMHCIDAQYDTTNNKWLTASFDNARQRCNDLKSTLIIIKDEETNNIVENYLSDPYNPIRFQNIWTDAYRISDYNNTHTWHWVNSAIPNIPDSAFSPSQDNTWYVASLEFRSKFVRSQFYLRAQQPHFYNSYVCEYPVSKCSSSGSNVGLLQIADRCYVTVNASVSWYEARNRCLKDGVDLSSFANITNINFTSWIRSDPNVRFWIGLRFSWYIWKDSAENVEFSKWAANYGDWASPCLIVCPNCNSSYSWYPKDCNTVDSIYVVCHTVTPLTATTLTSESVTTLPTSANTGSNSAGSDKSARSQPTALAVGVGVGVGVPVIVAIIVIVFCVVRSKTPVEKKTRNDKTELGAVQEPSVGQVNDSSNNQYQQLNRNLDNSSGTMYDEVRVAPETQYEEFPSNIT